MGRTFRKTSATPTQPSAHDQRPKPKLRVTSLIEGDDWQRPAEKEIWTITEDSYERYDRGYRRQITDLLLTPQGRYIYWTRIGVTFVFVRQWLSSELQERGLSYGESMQILTDRVACICGPDSLYGHHSLVYDPRSTTPRAFIPFLERPDPSQNPEITERRPIADMVQDLNRICSRLVEVARPMRTPERIDRRKGPERPCVIEGDDAWTLIFPTPEKYVAGEDSFGRYLSVEK